MAIYRCENCDEMVDDDYSPMQSHPYSKQFASYKDTMVCPDCYDVLEYDMKEALDEDRNDG